jgi:hypothetical protein
LQMLFGKISAVLLGIAAVMLLPLIVLQPG